MLSTCVSSQKPQTFTAVTHQSQLVPGWLKVILWGKVTSKCSCLLNNYDVASLSSPISLQKVGRKVSKWKEAVWKNLIHIL